MAEMALEEALARAKMRADACLNDYKRHGALERYDVPAGFVLYKEDWPVRYMKASLNGRMYPAIHFYSHIGGHIVLQVGADGFEWHLVPAFLVGRVDGEALVLMRRLRDEWNAEREVMHDSV